MTDVDLDKPSKVLRALLLEDFAAYRRLDAELGPAANPAFSVLLGTAFMNAAERHFGESSSPADVINFVAEVRARLETAGQLVSADDAERVIRAALGEDHLLERMDGRAIGGAQTAMLFALVQEDDPSPDAVDELLGKAADEAAGYFARRQGR
jgi:hypothetical protein